MTALYTLHVLLLVLGVALAVAFLIAWGRHVPRGRMLHWDTWDASGWVLILGFLCLLWLGAIGPHPARDYPADILFVRTTTFVVIDFLLVARYLQWRRVRRSAHVAAVAGSSFSDT